MKQVLISLLMLGLMSVTCIELSTVYANDGSLQIDTNIHHSEKNNELYYIEQDADLSKLFNYEVTEQINFKQQLEDQRAKNLKKAIFLESTDSDNWVKEYQDSLFHSYTKPTNSNHYSVQLTEKKKETPFLLIVLFVAGVSVTSFSLYRARRQKGRG